MDITTATSEQKVAAAVAYLSKHADLAPDASRKSLEKLNRINTEGMELVKQMQSMKQQIESMDAALGEKIGAGKILFEIVGEQLSPEQIDEFAKKFEPKILKPDNAEVDIAGVTAKKEVK